jgi:hypothetical protein
MPSPTLAAQDRHALVDLIVEFAWRVDHGSADTIHELVTDDVLISMHYGPMHGIEAIREWGSKRAGVERVTRHVMTNFRFRIVDADRVEATSLALTFRHDGAGPGPAEPWCLAECEDVFVRREGRWLFQSHVTDDVFLSE